jgi:3-methyl-2-oxobutanoate hydroxymethyltransferase
MGVRIHSSKRDKRLTCLSFCRFTKQYANIGQIMVDGLKKYHEEVKSRAFPAKENTYPINEAELARFFEQQAAEKKDNEESIKVAKAVTTA